MYPRCHQLVRIKDYNSPSLGLYGYIVAVDDMNCQVTVEFASEPELVSRNPKPQWSFGWADIEVIEDVPIAKLYMLVTILTIGRGEQLQHVLAHVEDDQLPRDVAETAAARFYGSLGNYDGLFYNWKQQQKSTKLVDFILISIAQYHFASQIMPDHNLGADVQGIPF